MQFGKRFRLAAELYEVNYPAAMRRSDVMRCFFLSCSRLGQYESMEGLPNPAMAEYDLERMTAPGLINPQTDEFDLLFDRFRYVCCAGCDYGGCLQSWAVSRFIARGAAMN